MPPASSHAAAARSGGLGTMMLPAILAFPLVGGAAGAAVGESIAIADGRRLTGQSAGSGAPQWALSTSESTTTTVSESTTITGESTTMTGESTTTTVGIADMDDDMCFACVKPADCDGFSCQIVGGCGAGVPAGYYPDLTNCNSYCYCTGTVAPSLYQTCNTGLEWDTHQQGNNLYLEGNYGSGGLWGTNGGGCTWPYSLSDAGKSRPGCGEPAVTNFSVGPDGDVCQETTSESPTPAPRTVEGSFAITVVASEAQAFISSADVEASFVASIAQRVGVPKSMVQVALSAVSGSGRRLSSGRAEVLVAYGITSQDVGSGSDLDSLYSTLASTSAEDFAADFVSEFEATGSGSSFSAVEGVPGSATHPEAVPGGESLSGAQAAFPQALLLATTVCTLMV